MAGQGRPITEADRRAVLRMAQVGTPQKEIARATRLCKQTVSRILKNRS